MCGPGQCCITPNRAYGMDIYTCVKRLYFSNYCSYTAPLTAICITRSTSPAISYVVDRALAVLFVSLLILGDTGIL